MKIEVTQEDIDRGVKKNCTRCPIAIAMQRAFSDTSLEITGLAVYRDSRKLKNLPRAVCVFVSDFDNGNLVQPFTFEIELP